jgi:hypothetical protein
MASGEIPDKGKKEHNVVAQERWTNMRKDTYSQGESVHITGGVHRRCGYTGVIAGKTRCYVDVWVPQLRQQLRVRKTSVRAAPGVAEKGHGGLGHAMPSAQKLDGGDPATLQLMSDLMAICVRLAELGVSEGDANLHAIIDAGLRRAGERQPERKKRGAKEKGGGKSGKAL